MFQILKDARNERQHCPISFAAVQSDGNSRASSVATLQFAAIDSPLPVISSGFQSIAERSTSRESRSCGSEKR
jgi:hypothetical protein